MNVIVNGETRSVNASTLADLLLELDYEGEWLATAVNAELVHREERGTWQLKRMTGSRSSRPAGRMTMTLTLYGKAVRSRLLLGTARYPSPLDLSAAVRQSGTEIVTVSLRRETAGGRTGGGFFEMIANWACMSTQYRGMLHRVRGRSHRQDGAGPVSDQLDQAGTDRHQDTLQPMSSSWWRQRESSVMTALRCFPTRRMIWLSANDCCRQAAKC